MDAEASRLGIKEPEVREEQIEHVHIVDEDSDTDCFYEDFSDDDAD